MRIRSASGNLLLTLRAHTDGEPTYRTGLAIVTLTSDSPAAAAARRDRALERQARVGILRNPNNPPLPPQRKARLTGKWPNLQSTRRPQARAQPDTAAAPTLTDTDLARMMKEASVPVPLDDTSCHADADLPDTVVVTPLPDRTPPPTTPQPDSPLPGDGPKQLVLIIGLIVLISLTLITTAR